MHLTFVACGPFTGVVGARACDCVCCVVACCVALVVALVPVPVPVPVPASSSQSSCRLFKAANSLTAATRAAGEREARMGSDGVIAGKGAGVGGGAARDGPAAVDAMRDAGVGAYVAGLAALGRDSPDN